MAIGDIYLEIVLKEGPSQGDVAVVVAVLEVLAVAISEVVWEASGAGTKEETIMIPITMTTHHQEDYPLQDMIMTEDLPHTCQETHMDILHNTEVVVAAHQDDPHPQICTCVEEHLPEIIEIIMTGLHHHETTMTCLLHLEGTLLLTHNAMQMKSRYLRRPIRNTLYNVSIALELFKDQPTGS